MKLVTALIDEYSMNRFFTLTLDPKLVNGEPWAYIQHPWSKMRKRLRRIKKDLRYVAILEKHPGKKYVGPNHQYESRGMPHIHGFTNLDFDWYEWRRHWQEVQGGSGVWLEELEDTVTAGEYVSKQIEVAKYVSKDRIMPAYKVEKRYRTLWRSEKTKAKFELKKSDDWVIIKERIFDEDNKLTEHGEIVRRAYGSQEE